MGFGVLSRDHLARRGSPRSFMSYCSTCSMRGVSMKKMKFQSVRPGRLICAELTSFMTGPLSGLLTERWRKYLTGTPSSRINRGIMLSGSRQGGHRIYVANPCWQRQGPLVLTERRLWPCKPFVFIQSWSVMSVQCQGDLASI